MVKMKRNRGLIRLVFCLSLKSHQINSFFSHPFHNLKELLVAWQPCWNHTVHTLLVLIWVSGDKQGALEFLKLIFRALCLCWDRQTQDLHVDWILFRGRSLVPTSCEVVNDNMDGYYPSSHYPIFAEFMLPRTVRLLEPPSQDANWAILTPHLFSYLFWSLHINFGLVGYFLISLLFACV